MLVYLVRVTSWLGWHASVSGVLLYVANTSTPNHRLNNVDHQCSSSLFQYLYFVENESWHDLYLSTLFQSWNNIVFSILKYDDHNFTTIISYHQNYFCLIQRYFNVDINVESTLTILRWFNVDIASIDVTTLSIPRVAGLASAL